MENALKHWFDLPRLEESSIRLSDSEIGNGITRINLDYGINLYRGGIPKDKSLNIITRLESSLSQSEFSWSLAQVNDKEEISENRNCVDFKYKSENITSNTDIAKELISIHSDTLERFKICLRDYESLWHLNMNYIEAFNFVKYMPGKYFKLHVDDGPFYSCTISGVIYLNDDYEGGEIEFTRHGLKIKPQAGDIILFPSNFIYEHASCEVFSGTKYSVVIMTDYNENNHKNH
jgi:predicted 2-oxoglutarate/Fe(II)-dependent dioxygenase YbiX